MGGLIGQTGGSKEIRPNPQVEKNKNWKAKFAKLEAKMVAMSVNLWG
jgi:hypothetical protein